MKFTNDEKHDIANRLALWLSASVGQYAATDEMRTHIRAWMDCQDSEEMRRETEKMRQWGEE